jgi:hypothetical protein
VLATGRDTVAAALFVHPHWQRKNALPLAVRSMKGWAKLHPPKARLPYPWEGVCLLALDALDQGLVDICLAILLMFCAYLRPAEPHKLLVSDFIVPIVGAAAQGYSIILHPFERLESSKTFEFDESVPVDLQFFMFIPVAIERLIRLQGRQGAEKLFRTSSVAINRFLAEASVRLNLQKLGEMHAYRLRHGGASADFLTRRRPLTDIQRIGRWRSHRSVRRYEKGSRAHQLLQQLDPATRSSVIGAEALLRQRLSNLL